MFNVLNGILFSWPRNEIVHWILLSPCVKRVHFQCIPGRCAQLCGGLSSWYSLWRGSQWSSSGVPCDICGPWMHSSQIWSSGGLLVGCRRSRQMREAVLSASLICRGPLHWLQSQCRSLRSTCWDWANSKHTASLYLQTQRQDSLVLLFNTVISILWDLHQSLYNCCCRVTTSYDTVYDTLSTIIPYSNFTDINLQSLMISVKNVEER